MAYKKLIKVSNVCQLVNKSNYPATGTRDGVTWTNNGDGTITANGATNEVYANYIIPMPQFKEVKNDHKYVLFSGINDINGAFVECICYLGGQDGSYFVTNCVETNIAGTFGFTIPQGEYPLWQRVELRVRRGYTANDLTFKPQLFDLTEMYGAGHEPTTVEQFRQDFPDEMYDYKPYSIIPSYKKSLVCKTKNLLNPNTCNIYQSAAFGMNIELIDNNQTVHVYGTSTDTGAFASFNVIKTSDKSIYNKGYKIKFFNLTGKNPPVIRNIYGLREVDIFGQIAITVNITEGVYYDFSFRIMVSEQTATDYVPYGHL